MTENKTLEVWLSEIAKLRPQQQLDLLVAQFRHRYAVDPAELGITVGLWQAWHGKVTAPSCIQHIYAFYPSASQRIGMPEACTLVMRDASRNFQLTL